jgi:hypothetical protein
MKHMVSDLTGLTVVMMSAGIKRAGDGLGVGRAVAQATAPLIFASFRSQ